MKEVTLEKKDWEELLKAAEMNIKQSLISMKQFQTLKNLAENELKALDDAENSEIKSDIDKLISEGS